MGVFFPSFITASFSTVRTTENFDYDNNTVNGMELHIKLVETFFFSASNF